MSTIKDEAETYTQASFLIRKQSSSAKNFTCCKLSDKMKAYKNLLAVSISFMLIIGAILTVQALQSSVNTKDGLGLTANAVAYATVVLTCFVGPSIVELIGTKYALISGYVLLLIYIILNYYPTWYTLIPASIFNGIGQLLILSCTFAHVISVAVLYAPALKETKAHAIALFTAVVAASVKISLILSGIATSLIFININSNVTIDRNSTAEMCTLEETTSLSTDDNIYYILISAYALMDIVGIIIAVVFMNNLGTNRPFMSAGKMCKLYFGNLPLGFLKIMLNWKMLLTFPMIILDGIALGYMYGTFSKVLVSDCIGVKWVGFALACFGTSGTITAVTVGRIQRYIPQYIIVYVSLSGLLGLSLFLILYPRQESFAMAFLYFTGWGMFEATLTAVSTALLGLLFPGQKKESALTLWPVALAIGFIISFVTGIFLSYITQLWIICGFILLTTITYSIVFFANATKAQLAPCINKEPIGDVEEQSNSDKEVLMK